MRADSKLWAMLAASAAALIWAMPFAWMAVASLRPGVPPDIASLTPSGPFGLGNFAEAWKSGSFPLWYLNTFLMCGGILGVQLVTISMAGYAFARLAFPGRDFEEAAMLDGASIPVLIRRVLLPLARPGLVAFAIVSVTAHWNEFLWPLMAVSSPRSQVLTVGLSTFASGAEAGSDWGVVAAGTFFVAAPLLILFVIFQRRFISSFVSSGIK